MSFVANFEDYLDHTFRERYIIEVHSESKEINNDEIINYLYNRVKNSKN